MDCEIASFSTSYSKIFPALALEIYHRRAGPKRLERHAVSLLVQRQAIAAAAS